MKRKLMICAMALCICAGLTGNTGEVCVWASEGSSSDAVRIGALKGPTAMGMAQLLDEDTILRLLHLRMRLFRW